MTGNGRIVYQGPSQLDGAPIVAIAIGFKVASKNIKTGSMIQTFVMRDEVGPIEALKTGKDASVCGDCRHRGTSCYVQVGQSVNGVWKAHNRRQRYPAANLAALPLLGHGRAIRLGSEIVAAYRDGGRVMLAYRRLVIAPAMEEHRVLAVQYGKSFDYAGAGELRFIGEVGFHAADGGRVYVFEIARR